MSTTKKLTSRRRYSDEFKKNRVKDFEKGTFSVGQMSRLYKIRKNVLYTWIHKYSSIDQTQAVIMEVPNSQTEKVKQLEEKLLYLERSLGRKQLELDYHKEFLKALAANGIDIEKKSTTTKHLEELYRNIKEQ